MKMNILKLEVSYLILTVSPHAMFGLKAKLENTEELNTSIMYKIILDDTKIPIFKNPNNCNEFINNNIQDWIIKNKYHKYYKRNPPKFLAKLDSSHTITVIGRLQ